MKLRTIHDLEVQSKRVLLRAGLNVPIVDGAVTDDFRMRQALRTIELLAQRGARVTIISHLGREGDSLMPVFEKLKTLSTVPMQFHDGPLADAPTGVEEGSCLMLQNIRREKGEEENSPELAQALAIRADIFVNDAFADSHRSHASIVGVAQLIPSYAGLLMEEEVENLSSALVPPVNSLAIIGGAKFETKEPLIKKLLSIYSEICVGGALSNDFLKARGYSVGASKISDKPVEKELAEDPRIHLQDDMTVMGPTGKRVAASTDIKNDERVVDAGPETSAHWSDKIKNAPLVLWNGPLGIYEEGYVDSTDALAEALVQSSARGIVGGGDTIAALEKFTFDQSRIFRSTGGGAMLEFLAEGSLVGLGSLVELK
jgi:phosphoglycerate kinase